MAMLMSSDEGPSAETSSAEGTPIRKKKKGSLQFDELEKKSGKPFSDKEKQIIEQAMALITSRAMAEAQETSPAPGQEPPAVTPSGRGKGKGRGKGRGK